MDLINNHPEKNDKIGNGIKKFIIEINRLNHKAYHINILRNDDSIIDFSWKVCAGCLKPNSLLSAMRHSISKQIIKYKKKNKSKLICKYCSSKENIHVDHKYPSFKKISTDYIKSIKLKIPNRFGSDAKTYQHTFTLEDQEFKNEWNSYHKKHAIYQLLCETCNIKKG